MVDQIVLFDGPQWEQLQPLTLTRPTAALRVGMTTVADKWSRRFAMEVCYHTKAYLRAKYLHTSQSRVLMINGALMPSTHLVQKLQSLKVNQGLIYKEQIVAMRCDAYDNSATAEDLLKKAECVELDDAEIISYPEDLLNLNDTWLFQDFELRARVNGQAAPSMTSLIGPSEGLYIHPDAQVYASSINSTDGPVYIDRGAIVMEGSMLRGPLYIGCNSVVKMGGKIYGKTSIGPRSKVGGEVKRVIMQGNSNKGHDGYLGDSVIGEWCNFGADTNISNMKNTYGKVKLYDMSRQRKRLTGETFLGLMMGDHCRCAINTSFNTGTVAAYFSNIFGGRPDSFIPPFSWGSDERYDIGKAIAVAKIVHNRRKIPFTTADESIIRHLYDQYRSHAAN